MAHKYTAKQVRGAVEEISRICCCKCNNTDIQDRITKDDPIDHVANDFFLSGWRITAAGLAYCPACAIKYLKLPDNPCSRENMKHNFDKL